MSETDQNPSAEGWRQWKERCAAALCDPEVEEAFQRFGRRHFQAHARFVPEASRQGAGWTRKVEGREAWHLLEAHFLAGRARSGKRYKDWLFLRCDGGAGDWLQAMEGGASVLMRDVVRETVRRECPPSFMHSMDSIDDSEEIPIEELIPSETYDPWRNLAEEEWLEQARHLAGEIVPRLGRRERVALWARSMGYGLSSSKVCHFANCTPGFLYKVHKIAVSSVCEQVRLFLPGASAVEHLHLARLVLEAAGQALAGSIHKERGAGRFFRVS